MKMRILSTILFCWFCSLLAVADNFDWRRANVYCVITDRFCNGDPTNDQQYGRQNDYGCVRLNCYENGVAVFVRRK